MKDLYPLLVCRLECPAHMAPDVDAWMPKHFDDALDEAPVTVAAGYRMQQDFASENGLPWIFNGHGNRFVAYATDSTQGLLDWLSGEMAKRSIEDGADRESAYPLLDGEPFTGNIYVGREVVGAVDAELAGEASILIERFEVGPALEADFIGWLEGDYLVRWSRIPGVARVRTFRQLGDVPDVFPYTRYVSKGNFMLWVDLDAGVDASALVRDERVNALLAESLIWDLRLPYVRREIADNFVIRTKGDALLTYGERRSSDGGP